MREINSSLQLQMSSGPTKVLVDTKSGIDLVSTLKTGHKTKHINMRINFIRQCINDGIISLFFCKSEHNVADVLTKPLTGKLYDNHTHVIMQGHGGKNPFEFLVAIVL